MSNDIVAVNGVIVGTNEKNAARVVNKKITLDDCENSGIHLKCHSQRQNHIFLSVAAKVFILAIYINNYHCNNNVCSHEHCKKQKA